MNVDDMFYIQKVLKKMNIRARKIMELRNAGKQDEYNRLIKSNENDYRLVCGMLPDNYEIFYAQADDGALQYRLERCEP